jgi:hypothetical protein
MGLTVKKIAVLHLPLISIYEIFALMIKISVEVFYTAPLNFELRLMLHFLELYRPLRETRKKCMG